MAYDIDYASGIAWQQPLLRVPRTPAPRPGLILLHGSEGAFAGWTDVVAVELAYRGFVTYPHPYSQGGNLWQAGAIIEYPLEETVKAMRWLRKHPSTNGKLGLWGGSRGAEHALLLTSLLARDQPDDLPDAVVAQSGPDTIVGGQIGTALHAPNRDAAVWDPALRAWSWRGSSEDLKPTTPIEIERYAGPIMLTTGAKDQMWSSKQTRRLAKRLKAAGREPEVHIFKEDGHWYAPERLGRAYDLWTDFLERHLAGGTQAQSARQPLGARQRRVQ
jgi:dipeptidyl aminopeptidase/acylaminoacyl peptidase